jgi:hypothetical protein
MAVPDNHDDRKHDKITIWQPKGNQVEGLLADPLQKPTLFPAIHSMTR